jgi:hypothetical protein
LFRFAIFIPLIISSFLPAQVQLPDFYSVKAEIDEEEKKFRESSVIKTPVDPKDTAALSKIGDQVFVALQAFELKRNGFISKLKGATYPDFYFEDYNGKSYSLSDFNKEKVILNFNYSFCDLCMNQVDSLVKLSAGKAKVIVLLYDKKENVTELFERFGDKVLMGFTNRETISYYSLKTGSFSIFLLEKEREFSDFYAGRVENVPLFYNRLRSF